MRLNKFDGRFWQENSADDFAGRGEDRSKVPVQPRGITDSNEGSLHGQRNDNARAVFEAGSNADVAAMRFDDAPDYGQTKSGAFDLGCA